MANEIRNLEASRLITAEMAAGQEGGPVRPADLRSRLRYDSIPRAANLRLEVQLGFLNCRGVRVERDLGGVSGVLQVPGEPPHHEPKGVSGWAFGP